MATCEENEIREKNAIWMIIRDLKDHRPEAEQNMMRTSFEFSLLSFTGNSELTTETGESMSLPFC